MTVEEMEARLLALARRFGGWDGKRLIPAANASRDLSAQDEYRRLHARWVAEKNQGRLDV